MGKYTSRYIIPDKLLTTMAQSKHTPTPMEGVSQQQAAHLLQFLTNVKRDNHTLKRELNKLENQYESTKAKKSKLKQKLINVTSEYSTAVDQCAEIKAKIKGLKLEIKKSRKQYKDDDSSDDD